MMLKSEKSTKKIAAFVAKLLSMLNDIENKELIGWADFPNSFVISDPNELAKSILPKYYKHNNLSSFIRQLNIYGFEKIKTEQNQHFYHHEHLSMNNLKEVAKIQRKNPIRPSKLKQFSESDDSNYHLYSHPKKNDKPDFSTQKSEDKEAVISVEDHEKEIRSIIEVFSFLLKNNSFMPESELKTIKEEALDARKRYEFLQSFSPNQKDRSLVENYSFQKNQNQLTHQQTNKNKQEDSFGNQNFMEDGDGSQNNGFLALENAEEFNSDGSNQNLL